MDTIYFGSMAIVFIDTLTFVWNRKKASRPITFFDVLHCLALMFFPLVNTIYAFVVIAATFVDDENSTLSGKKH